MATTPSIVDVPESYFVYKLQNKISGNIYIGITSSLKRRINEHCRDSKNGSCLPVHRAIRKYGLDSFSISILKRCCSWPDACEAERSMISHYDSFNNGYNCTLGGDGRSGIPHSEETKQKISESMLGKNKYKHSPEHIAKHAASIRGRKHSEETKLKMRLSSPRKKLTPEHKLKISWIGKNHTEKSKNKISESKKDKRIYLFQSKDGTTIRCTRSEFCKNYGVHKSSISKLIQGKRKSLKGWVIVNG